MPEVSLTGSDTAQIDQLIIQSLADQTPFELTFPNDLANVKAGKNGNTIYAKNEGGRVCAVTLRVLAGTSADQYLQGRMQEFINDESSFTLMTGIFTKHVGDGSGTVHAIISNCSGGIFKRQVGRKTSAEGDTDQSVATYELLFGNCQQSIQ